MSESNYKQPDLLLLVTRHRAYRGSRRRGRLHLDGLTLLLTAGTAPAKMHPPRSFSRATAMTISVVASMGGAPSHPLWYLNLQANPEATVQVKADTHPVVARTASAAEKPKLWKIVTDVWPNYDVTTATFPSYPFRRHDPD